MNDKPLVLLVDDTPTNLHVLIRSLQDDYRVKIATSGAKALEIAQSADKPDLILLDVMMPEIDGYEVCRRLKENPATHRIPIIFVTALDNPSDEERGLNLGAEDYVTKPFAMPVVRARVRNHIRFKQTVELLESMAFIDGLTCLSNRRHFDQTLDTEWKRSLRNGEPLALILADVDNFKKYNDHFGHGKGDECLKKVAKAFAESVNRPGDVVARYGGEAFVAILPNTDSMGAAVIAEKFRNRVIELALASAPGANMPVVTVSVGCASSSLSTGDAAALPLPALVESADQALYRAKQNGRNRVEVNG